jgi:hypothetical protein
MLAILGAPGTAQAHRDTALSLQPDGTIAGLPAEYLPARLLLDRDKTGRIVGATLRLKGGQYTFPECLVRTLDQNPRAKPGLAGSWYHDEGILPYYIWITMRSEERRPGLAPPHLRFNLRTAEPMFDKPHFERPCPGKRMADGWRPNVAN